MGKKLNINSGDIFGDLTIVKEVDRKYPTRRRFLCTCICGNTKEVELVNLTTKVVRSCGCYVARFNKEMRGSKSKSWKGGRIIDDEGYVCIYKPEHENSKSNGYIREHRFIISEKLNRPLLKNENVHHKNGVKTDNRLENLELWSTYQPCGQRVIDKINWAREILKLYENYEL